MIYLKLLNVGLEAFLIKLVTQPWGIVEKLA